MTQTMLELLRGKRTSRLPTFDPSLFSLGPDNSSERPGTSSPLIRFSSRGHAAAERQAVAERTGGGLDPRQKVRRRMLGEPAAVLAESFQFLDRKKTLHRQHGIERRGRMALGQDEAIPQRVIRPFRIDIQHMPIRRGQHIGAGQ